MPPASQGRRSITANGSRTHFGALQSTASRVERISEVTSHDLIARAVNDVHNSQSLRPRHTFSSNFGGISLMVSAVGVVVTGRAIGVVRITHRFSTSLPYFDCSLSWFRSTKDRFPCGRLRRGERPRDDEYGQREHEDRRIWERKWIWQHQ